MHDTRSEFAANLTLADDTPNWQKPSRCKRPYVMDGGRQHQVDPFEDGWRDAELTNDVPPDASRTFRPMFQRRARSVSLWPLIIVTILATTACALIIGWFVNAALQVAL